MRALVLGCGSIGSRHARNLRELGVDVTVADVDPGRALELAHEIGADAVDRRDSPDVELVVVATPTAHHAADLEESLQRGAHVFVEKPLACSVAGVERALTSADAHPDARIMVGCNLRFTEGFGQLTSALQIAGRIALLLVDFGWWLPSWRPQHDYRRQYSAQRDQGGGIVLDAIHEIDYTLALAGPALDVQASWSRTGLLELDVEDVADIVIRHESGAQSNLHVDYLRRGYSRSCVVVGADADVSWDFAAGTVTLRRAAGADAEFLAQDLDRDRNRQYLDEMQHMLDAIDSGTTPTNSLPEAAATTRVALEALRVGAPR